MRKIYLFIISLSVFVGSTNAQIKKSSIFLGGDIGGSFQQTKTDDITSNKVSTINISPVFGKAIKENLVLGVNAGFNLYDNNLIIDDAEYKTHAYNAGIFIRKYKNIGNEGFYLFIQAGLNGTYFKQKLVGFPGADLDELKRIGIGLSAYPGLSYGITKKLHLETGFNNLLSLNFFNEKREATDPSPTTIKTNGFSISSSLNNATSALYLGFRLLIGK